MFCLESIFLYRCLDFFKFKTAPVPSLKSSHPKIKTYKKLFHSIKQQQTKTSNKIIEKSEKREKVK